MVLANPLFGWLEFRPAIKRTIHGKFEDVFGSWKWGDASVHRWGTELTVTHKQIFPESGADVHIRLVLV